ncbi:hypothetical protein QQZ08_006841 [Neonectria magnoliae]|uniref:Peptidase S12 Pab87-related C-terminal domain-containing protein n=1 Tax=Neonectria magnoliae TaxID=2732573 RepID=A0ABR1I136_9HYPO
MNLVTNPDVDSRDYSIGRDSEDRLVTGHTGELGGFLSAYWTFPDDDCSLVVLTNSFQVNGGSTSIIAQLLAQTLFDMRPVVDFKEVARNVVSNTKGRCDIITKEWNAHRIPNTCPGPLDAYVGEYSNDGLAMSLSATRTSDAPCPLRLCINGIEEQVFELYHYHTDSRTFLQSTRDACIENGYSMYLLSWESWIIEFDLSEDGLFGKIKWVLDPDEPVDSQVFLRK